MHAIFKEVKYGIKQIYIFDLISKIWNCNSSVSIVIFIQYINYVYIEWKIILNKFIQFLFYI